jgi:hypothetical protein
MRTWVLGREDVPHVVPFVGFSKLVLLLARDALVLLVGHAVKFGVQISVADVSVTMSDVILVTCGVFEDHEAAFAGEFRRVLSVEVLFNTLNRDELEMEACSILFRIELPKRTGEQLSGSVRRLPPSSSADGHPRRQLLRRLCRRVARFVFLVDL